MRANHTQQYIKDIEAVLQAISYWYWQEPFDFNLKEDRRILKQDTLRAAIEDLEFRTHILASYLKKEHSL